MPPLSTFLSVCKDATTADTSLPPSSQERTLPSSSPMSLDWTGLGSESPMPVDSRSPSPTVRAARARILAGVNHLGLTLQDELRGEIGSVPAASNQTQTARPQAWPMNALSGDRGTQEDEATDYFAFFSSPPVLVDPPHYRNHVLQGAPRNEPPLPVPTNYLFGHAEEREPMTQSNDPRDIYHGELPYDPAPLDHSRKPRKRLWLGSPDPEDVLRGQRRARPQNSTPLWLSRARLTGGGCDDSDPWGNQLREQELREEGQTIPAFIPVTASTPANPVHAANIRLCSRLGRAPDGYQYAELQPGGTAGETDARQRKRPGTCPSTDPEDEQEPEPLPNTEQGAWSEAELMEARQRSLRQAMEERTGYEAGARPTCPNQTHGAGPSGPRYAREAYGAETDEGRRNPRDELSSRAPTYYGDYTRNRGRGLPSGPPDTPGTCWNDYDVLRRPRPNAPLSDFVPLPNTRAARYMANNGLGHRREPPPLLPQRSPVSQMPNLQHPQPYPSRSGPASGHWPMDEDRENGRLSSASNQRLRPSAHEPAADDMPTREQERDYGDYDGWPQEDGEILPSALCIGDTEENMGPTDVPTGGFPRVHRDDPEAPYGGMATDWLREMWSDPPHTIVFADVYNYRYTEDDAYNRRIADNLRRRLESITEETDFDVVPPEPEEGAGTRTRDLPTLWAIRGLTPDGVARALARRVWSFPSITFFTSPRSTTVTLSSVTLTKEP
ncbi:hypothetical protein C8T65DRAFT_740298 [Cerioporus squamosus]|nr:hypothetical protein C8T65DRAFT_740298 [Cerioporus squamosus]